MKTPRFHGFAARASRGNASAANVRLARFLPGLQHPVTDLKRFDDMARGLVRVADIRLRRIKLRHKPRQKMQETHAYTCTVVCSSPRIKHSMRICQGSLPALASLYARGNKPPKVQRWRFFTDGR